MYDPKICVGNIIPNLELPDFQNIGVQEVLLNKKMLLAFDTGTGKTFTYSLIVRALLNRNPEKKHIFVIIHDSLEQAPRDIGNLIAAPVLTCAASSSDYSKLVRGWAVASVIVLTYECFRDERFVLFLFERLTEIESFVVDEAHHIANWDDSNTALMIRAFMQYVPYVVGLSATPMTSHVTQFYQLLNSIDRSLSSRRNEENIGKYEDRYLPVNRSDYDIKGKYTVTLELVTPHMHQVGEIHGVVSRVVKGTGAENQANALIKLTQERLQQGKTVIIYVYYHDSRQWIEGFLEKVGISFVSLHGKILDQKERKNILDKFNSHEVNVLVTSVSESLNIDSDVVIFYEFTTKLKQVMGRAHRGLMGKELELVFILTKDTEEISYFMKYIYERSLTMQKILRKDYSEFLAVGEALKQLDYDGS